MDFRIFLTIYHIPYTIYEHMPSVARRILECRLCQKIKILFLFVSVVFSSGL